MRKLLVLCLIVLFASCKDKDKDSAPDPDYAPELVGNYSTLTVEPNLSITQDWEVTDIDKNLLAITFTKTNKVTASGSSVSFVQIYKLKDVKVTGQGTIAIDEVVDVEQTLPDKLQQKVQGVGTLVTNSAGNPQINITLKFSNTAKSDTYENYLEFKKK